MAGKFINWGFTLNNYTEQELLTLRNFPDFVVETHWELEKGDEGTPHIQGYIKIKTQQRTSFLKNHFLARAHWTGLGSEEYKENMKKYATKQDSTAVGSAVQQRNTEPILFPAVIPQMIVEEIMSFDPPVQRPNSAWWSEESKKWFDVQYDRAASALVTRCRVEMLVSRSDIRTSTRLHYNEIKLRIEHNRNADHEETQGVSIQEAPSSTS